MWAAFVNNIRGILLDLLLYSTFVLLFFFFPFLSSVRSLAYIHFQGPQFCRIWPYNCYRSY